MVDELVEPQESRVPEQADMFRQGAEPEPEPVAPAPEPEPVAPEPVVEPELPPVEPDWLNVPAEPPPQQAQYPPPHQYYEPPPQPYPQQPQVPRGTGADAALQTFVDQPEGWTDNRIDARLAPIQQQQQQMANIASMLINDRVNEGTAQADAAVRKAYEVFNRDATFRSNKGMQDSLGATLQGMRQRAEYEARATGNFEPLRTLANLSESDMEATLAYMRAKSGTQSPGVAPLQIEGASVESSRSSVAEQATELPAEFEEIANRLGPHGRERLIKQIQVTKDADDFEG